MVLNELRKLRSQVRDGSSAILPYVEHFMKALDGAKLDFMKVEAKFKFLEGGNFPPDNTTN